ncbi:MAG: polynucleotide adenylyltransferase PcnB [Deltaproteobacteria bacterium]|nr:polynucleotide adenylyltransferase PcnB [Deltaproteobacteria bacterium]
MIDDLPETVEAAQAAEAAELDQDAKNAHATAHEDAEKGNATVDDSQHEIPLHSIDEDALWVVRRLRAKGYEAYLTGGCVRDLLLGHSPKDFDVATAATPNEVRSAFRNCRLVGRRFRLAHVFFPGGKVIETATFRANPLEAHDEDNLPEDLLLERDNVWGDVEQDARRRDLTINGLFYDPLEGKVIDYVKGRVDLDSKLIRTIGDPQVRFQEDPVRILRVVKFATRLGFDIEPETTQAMKNHAGELLRCAPARLQEEMLKLFTSTHAETCMGLMREIGVESVLIPELPECLRMELEPIPVVEVPEVPAEEAKAESDDAAPAEAPVEEARAEGDDAAPAAAPVEDAKAKGDDAAPAAAPVEDAKAKGDDAAPVEDVKAEGDEEGFRRGRGRGRGRRGRRGRPERNEAPAPVGAPAPVLVLPSVEERQERFDALLKSLDEVRRCNTEVTPAVVLSTLFLAGYEALSASTTDEDEWLEAQCDKWTDRMRLTRRDREGMRVLLQSLPTFRDGLRHGSAARSMVQRPWFREGLLLFIISERAKGNDLDAVGKWKAIAAHYQQDYRQARPGSREPRPRSRQRQRRRSSSNSNRRRRN